MTRMRSRGDVEGDTRARELTRVRDFLPSFTQAGPALDCDINVIVRRFGIDNEVMPTAVMDPRYYGDFDMSLSLGEALNRIDEASSRFSALPVAIRNKFDNSPAKLWEFVNDPRNADEAVSMGLLSREVAPGSTISASPTPGKPPAAEGGGSASGASQAVPAGGSPPGA